MAAINFFTAVSYGNNSKSICQFLLEEVDSYFYLGGSKVEVIADQIKESREGVVWINEPSSLITTALKVVSYFIIVLPLILLVVKAILRATHDFYFLNQLPNSDADSARASAEIERQRVAAAIKIQSSYRRRVARLKLEALKNEKRQTAAAVNIQSICRMHLAHSQLKQLKSEKLEKEAIITLQSVLRSHSAQIAAEKERRNFLRYDLFEQAKPYIDTASKRKNLPVAPRGSTTVYLPPELPIVLKASGSPQNIKRFVQMRQARDICDPIGTHLVIPAARVYGDFIIETRLPITEHETKQQIGFYIENREHFTSAIVEFVEFLCHAEMYDITGRSNKPYTALSETPIGRYDNIALYVEVQNGEIKGNIGLIDLEEFKPGCAKDEREWCYFKCRDVIRLFPYHFDAIIEAAKKFDPNIWRYRKLLESERDGSLKRFKTIYEDHLDFVKEKGITFANPGKLVEISAARKESLTALMAAWMRKQHDDEFGFYTSCLGENPDRTMQKLEERFPKVLDLILNFLSNKLENQIAKNGTISSYRKLLFCRTFLFAELLVEYEKLRNEVLLELELIKIEDYQKSEFTCLVIESIFKELANGREIAYYNPSLGCGGHAVQCIFC